MITIWGRANSVNVQKVLWVYDELELPYYRIDAGLHFGRNDEADYLAMNPMGKIPTLVDGRRFTIVDIVLGSFAKRWFGLPDIKRPSMRDLERWYRRLSTGAGFRKYVDLELT